MNEYIMVMFESFLKVEKEEMKYTTNKFTKHTIFSNCGLPQEWMKNDMGQFELPTKNTTITMAAFLGIKKESMKICFHGRTVEDEILTEAYRFNGEEWVMNPKIQGRANSTDWCALSENDRISDDEIPFDDLVITFGCIYSLF